MRQKREVTKVTALLPYSVDLTKLTSNNTLDVQVRSGDYLLGTFKMGRGSVQWWPGGNKTNRMSKTWAQFAEMLNASIGS